MADDIVTMLHLEAAEWEGFCEDIHLPILEAAAEIERLRGREQDLLMHLEQDACEIELLRAAGDDIADLLAGIASSRLDGHEKATVDKYLAKWQEARRG